MASDIATPAVTANAAILASAILFFLNQII
jgi:hypothetical protein